MRPLPALACLFVLVYAGEPIKFGFLLIYMDEQLKLDPAVRGAVIGLQPLIRLMIMHSAWAWAPSSARSG